MSDSLCMGFLVLFLVLMLLLIVWMVGNSTSPERRQAKKEAQERRIKESEEARRRNVVRFCGHCKKQLPSTLKPSPTGIAHCPHCGVGVR